MSAKMIYYRNLTKGCCGECGAKKEGLKARCPACQQRNRDAQKRLCAARKEAGRCIQCNRDKEDLAFVRCARCKEARDRRRRQEMEV